MERYDDNLPGVVSEKELTKVKWLYRVQLIMIFAPVLIFVGLLILFSRLSQSSGDDAAGYLNSQYIGNINMAVSLIVTVFITFALQFICFIKLRNIVNKDVSRLVNLRNASVIAGVTVVLSIVFGLTAGMIFEHEDIRENVIELLVTPVVLFVFANVMSKGFGRGDKSMTYKKLSAYALVFVTVLSVLFGYMSVHFISEAQPYAADLRQIKENRLTEDLFYVRENIRAGNTVDYITARTVERELYSFRFNMVVPKCLEFNPEPSDLIREGGNRSVGQALEEGLKVYRITYTDNKKVVVSIEAVTD